MGLILVMTGFASAEHTFSQEVWYFLRGNQPVMPDEKLVDIMVVGDIMPGRGVSAVRQPFKLVKDELAAADLTVGNFEGVFAERKQIRASHYPASTTSKIRLLIPFNKRAGLRDAGFDVLSLANNHSLDLGSKGLRRTVETLHAVGIKTIGAGPSENDAYQPVFTETHGVKVAFLAADAISEPKVDQSSSRSTDWNVARWDLGKLQEVLKDAHKSADVVILLIHWGEEYELKAGPLQKETAQKLIDAGADIIIGCHPHVIQETAVLRQSSDPQKTGFVAYSLGNFVFDQYSDITKNGLALHIYIDKAGLRAVRPLAINSGPFPNFQFGELAQETLDRYKPQPDVISYSCTHTECHSIQTSTKWTDGLFTSGEIDLTGDGIPEQVLLRDGRVSIFENGDSVWQSPPEWKILDVVLGDLNLDGRGEVTIALQKTDQDGVIETHPFLIGYRGGIYRQVWGGSAVSRPILEIEIADLDGDQDQELVVLEQDSMSLDRFVSVWRYSDWYFNRVWTSTPGNYSHIHITTDSKTGQAVIEITRPW
jgi:poly-gamma-glutamate capsule biosynthesis protein CapA/YwtB (metallophosphatase superfamily)